MISYPVRVFNDILMLMYANITIHRFIFYFCQWFVTFIIHMYEVELI